MILRSISKPVNAGFSLIETILTLSLLSFFATLGIGVSMQTFLHSGLAEERDIFISLLEDARARSMANVHASSHGVNVSATSFTLFENMFDSHTPSNTSIPRNAHIVFSGDPTILFTQLDGGNAQGSETIVLTYQGMSATVTVTSQGRIDW